MLTKYIHFDDQLNVLTFLSPLQWPALAVTCKTWGYFIRRYFHANGWVIACILEEYSQESEVAQACDLRTFAARMGDAGLKPLLGDKIPLTLHLADFL